MAGNDSRSRPPRDFVIDGAWPHATLTDHHGAHVAQRLARRLAQAMAEQGLSANRLAHDSGVNRQTIANVLAGAVWPDLLTIAKLERALACHLWPAHQHTR
ncbi:DNA-binding transcriptional regulator, XRE-family HTH domain [Thermomonospora echinospora]|uniref:DNA-binding transcriptional regulator, XRE-family HTH domain n=1 Tax=Thermomonospora echinospora TaxID=1992 RepID=A0A1H6CSG8_9ACTN|nr:helix-turn-helix transcriptional regulator [Thermomonospora echinospora]SEG75798.1 DNA-binding transcriptional regulator, XRE-family HTH domain [Thermomonospora echinospora]